MDPAVVDVAFEERYWYPHDGGVVWVAGYQLVDPVSGRYLAGDAPAVAAAGLIVASVAGAARQNAGLAKGVNVVAGKVTYAPVAEATGQPYADLFDALGEEAAA